MPIIKSPEDLDYDYLHQLYANKIFRDYDPTTVSSRAFESIKISNDGLTLKLIDRSQRDLVSLIHGNITNYHKINYFEIVWTYSKLERRGHLTYLFKILVEELNYKILSDKYHSSPGSKEFWTAQIRRKNFNIYRINLTTNFKRKANKFKENQIWSTDDLDFSHIFPYNFENFIEDNIVGEVDPDYLGEFDEELDFGRILQNRTSINENISLGLNDNPMEVIRLIAQKYSI
ncbi:hypothetical protein OQY15_00015 [Pedobacter sp. MC2016-15]|uniref:hypothetical protein n=1 Tax=Pedobacter sp. MC2016-15 TaxID=2994473 RepID=UPI0022471E57|nr:hypothetical protein [Pedobacter sp. MC2016-15]MCX2477453.1 hypothetical protein [Pedobacter sp. MC2016-15]